MLFTWNQSIEWLNNISNPDVTGPNVFPNVFEMPLDNGPSVRQAQPTKVNAATGPSVLAPNPMTTMTDAETGEQDNGITSDGAAFQLPLTIDIVWEAFDALKMILKPPRDIGGGYKAFGH